VIRVAAKKGMKQKEGYHREREKKFGLEIWIFQFLKSV